MKKWILTLFILGFSLACFWLIQNNQMPVGYDHGAYREFINLLQNGSEYYSLRTYLQVQFEPFSWALFYYMGTIMPASFIVTWFYAIIYLGIALWLLFIGKDKNKYTIASYLWFGLFFFSVIQYTALWWWFGKEIIATFFLLWAIRHRKKLIIATIFMAACMALHRLTGFVGLLFIASLLLDKNIKGRSLYIWLLLFSASIAGITYFWTWQRQIMPFLWQKISGYVFLDGSYGTLFSGIKFWFFESWLLLCGTAALLHSIVRRKSLHANKHHLVLFWSLGFMVVARCIAHTRLWVFFDLALIMLLARVLPQVFTKKIMLFVVTIQAAIWIHHLSFYHTPNISEWELNKIEAIHKYLPQDSKIFVLNARYMPWLQGYSGLEIVTPYVAWYIKNNWSSLVKVMQNPEELCNILKKMPENTYLFVGEKERFYPSIQKNKCLSEVIYINQESRVFTLNSDYKKEFPLTKLQRSQGAARCR